MDRPHLGPPRRFAALAFATALVLNPGCSYAPYRIEAVKELEGCIIKKEYQHSVGAKPDRLTLRVVIPQYGEKQVIAVGAEQVIEADANFRESDLIRITLHETDLLPQITDHDKRLKAAQARAERMARNKAYALGGSRSGSVTAEIIDPDSPDCTG